MKQKYDFICSLGGNCSVAHNLRYRNMRSFSLPFDWVYITEDEALDNFISGLKNNFKDFCKKENMIRIPDTANHGIVYKDSYSKYIFPNHFTCDELDQKSYNEFFNKFQRRIDRLFKYINESSSVLFVFANNMKDIKVEKFEKLYDMLHELWPDKNFEIKVMLFNSGCDKEIIKNNISINYYVREQNLYDFNKTNFEWAFLDNIELSKLFIKKISWAERLFIMFCPIKKFRKELRKKFVR